MYICFIMPTLAASAAVLAAEAVLLQRMWKSSGGTMKSVRKRYRQSSQSRAISAMGGKRRTVARKVKGVNNRLKELKRVTDSDTGTHTQRSRQTWNVLAAVNQQGFISISTISDATLEAVLAQLRYYNPSTPTSLVQADGAAGSFQKDFYFTKAYSKITVRNNYRVPCMVNVYSCGVKADTDLTPGSAWVAGLANIGSPAQTNPLVKFTDPPIVNDLWRILKNKKRRLEPGQSFVMSHAPPPFNFSPSTSDSHNLDFQRSFRGHSWHLHVQGVIAHDITDDEQGIEQAGIDLVIDTTFVVKYPAGANIVYLHVDDQSATFTNDAVVSNRPVASNQTYSQAAGM